MAFSIRMGLPEMEALWNDFATRKQQGKLDKDEERFFKNLVKKPLVIWRKIHGTTVWLRTKLMT